MAISPPQEALTVWLLPRYFTDRRGHMGDQVDYTPLTGPQRTDASPILSRTLNSEQICLKDIDTL